MPQGTQRLLQSLASKTARVHKLRRFRFGEPRPACGPSCSRQPAIAVQQSPEIQVRAREAAEHQQQQLAKAGALGARALSPWPREYCKLCKRCSAARPDRQQSRARRPERRRHPPLLRAPNRGTLPFDSPGSVTLLLTQHTMRRQQTCLRAGRLATW